MYCREARFPSGVVASSTGALTHGRENSIYSSFGVGLFAEYVRINECPVDAAELKHCDNSYNSVDRINFGQYLECSRVRFRLVDVDSMDDVITSFDASGLLQADRYLEA